MDQVGIEPSVHSTPTACQPDITPPIFSGIATLVARTNGSLRLTWLAATDPAIPIEYEIYIQKNTAAALFFASNICMVSRALTADIFQDALGDLLEMNQLYYVGVRARDAVGNVDNNLVSLSATSQGVAPDSLCNLASELIMVTNQLQSEQDVLRKATMALGSCTIDSEITATGRVESEIVSVIDLEC